MDSNPPVLTSLRAGDLSVSLADAVRIFDYFADRDDLVFNWLKDGCYARGHIMCNDLVEMGLFPWKGWILEGTGGVYAEIPGRMTTYWGYHVAPVIPVRGVDGAVRQMIIDPAIFDGPATMAEWVSALHGVPREVHLVPYDTAPPGLPNSYAPPDGDMPPVTDFTANARQVLQYYSGLQHQFFKWMLTDRRLVLPSAARREISGQEISAGRTWANTRDILLPPPAPPAPQAPRPPAP